MTGEVDLLGKKPADLQTDINIDENTITGTLNYVTGYTGFNESATEEQEGNFLALQFEATADSKVTVEIIGGKKGPVILDDDMMFVGRITDKNNQSVKVVCKKGSNTVTETYVLSGLTLQAKPDTRSSKNRR